MSLPVVLPLWSQDVCVCAALSEVQRIVVCRAEDSENIGLRDQGSGLKTAGFVICGRREAIGERQGLRGKTRRMVARVYNTRTDVFVGIGKNGSRTHDHA